MICDTCRIDRNYGNTIAMDIKGEKVSLTPSEAHWAQHASMRSRAMAMPEVAQRMLDARVAFAHPWLTSLEIPPITITIKEMKDVMARIALSHAMDTLHETTLQHATDEVGEEQHVITIPMSKPEKERLLQLAQISYEVAEQQLESPEIIALENSVIIDHFAMVAATSDIMEPDEALELVDWLHDPEVTADHEAYQQEEATREVRILTPIIAALERDLYTKT
jgi:hypothetical protein